MIRSELKPGETPETLRAGQTLLGIFVGELAALGAIELTLAAQENTEAMGPVGLVGGLAVLGSGALFNHINNRNIKNNSN